MRLRHLEVAGSNPAPGTLLIDLSFQIAWDSFISQVSLLIKPDKFHLTFTTFPSG